ncbi:MAG TPA: cyanophycinase, partial [Acidobacteriota bacterium]|nr:cyanophycinase [Acidobacteriota bacterium]
HFIARKRHNRLISLVAEYPQILGIGIDESTAVIVKPDETFEVFGESNVIVYDASGADTEILPSCKMSAYGIVMHILKSEDQFNLKSKKVMEK